MRLKQIPPLEAGAAAAYAAFAAALGARIAGRPFLPSQVVAPLGAVALLLTLALAARTLRSIGHGPRPRAVDEEGSARLEGVDAERVRRAVRSWSSTGGGGYVRPWLRIVPAAALLAAAGVLLSGLLNVALRVEGTWLQFAESGRDLDVAATYRDLSLGTLADPSELRYGVLVGSIRPTEPGRIADLQVIDATGSPVAETALGAGRTLRVQGIELYQWAMGPGVHVTVAHPKRGQLLDQGIPLWPTGEVGRWAERVEGKGLILDLRLDGWPALDPAAGELQVSLREGDETLFEGPVRPRKAYAARGDYAVIAWEIRPYVGLGVAHRTFRRMTEVTLAALVLLLLAWPLLPARAFWYREDPDGSIRIQPPGAWAALERVRR